MVTTTISKGVGGPLPSYVPPSFLPHLSTHAAALLCPLARRTSGSPSPCSAWEGGTYLEVGGESGECGVVLRGLEQRLDQPLHARARLEQQQVVGRALAVAVLEVLHVAQHHILPHRRDTGERSLISHDTGHTYM